MPIHDLIPALAIHFVLPSLGIFVYNYLVKKLQNQGVAAPPEHGVFWSVLNYTALLFCILIALFWHPNGLGSIAFFYVVLVAPFVSAFVAFKIHPVRSQSIYHKGVYWSSFIYLLILLGLLLVVWELLY